MIWTTTIEPEGLADELEALRDEAKAVYREGAGPGSLTDEGLDYAVLDGDRVSELLPELAIRYASTFLNAARELTDLQLEVSPDTPSALNINYLDAGGRYELHKDAQPYTASWLVQDFKPWEGGWLTLYDDDGIAIWRQLPQRGLFVLFDGARLAHRVERTERLRVSVPMVFLPSGVEVERPDGLDEHIF